MFRRLLLIIALASVAVSVTACGQKGPLVPRAASHGAALR